MKIKPDSYFLCAGIFLPVLFIGILVYVSVVWVKNPIPEQIGSFLALPAMILVGLIAWASQWRLWFSSLVLDGKGIRETMFILQTNSH